MTMTKNISLKWQLLSVKSSLNPGSLSITEVKPRRPLFRRISFQNIYSTSYDQK